MEPNVVVARRCALHGVGKWAQSPPISASKRERESDEEDLGVGDYEVKFLGSPVAIAIGNIVDAPGFTDNAFTQIGAGDFEVLVRNDVLNAAQDRQFAVVTP
jgi:hypothetical protein